MIYGGTITTPANTAAASPMETVYQITAGLIYHVKVLFPPGSCGLLHVQVFDAEYQLFPKTHGASFSGNSILLEYDELYIKGTPPYLLTVRTWNLDDTYSHDVMVHMSLEDRENFKARYLPLMQASALLEAVGMPEVEASQARQRKLADFLASIPGEEAPSGANEVP